MYRAQPITETDDPELYSIVHDLAVNATYEEVVHLLLYGQLPTHSELHDLGAKLTEARALPSALIAIMHAIPKDAWPMDVLRTSISALAHYVPHRRDGSLRLVAGVDPRDHNAGRSQIEYALTADWIVPGESNQRGRRRSLDRLQLVQQVLVVARAMLQVD